MTAYAGRGHIWPALLLAGLSGGCGATGSSTSINDANQPPPIEIGSSRVRSKVRAVVQMRPGGPREEAEMPVHSVPVDPPSVAADEADLDEDELVLGVLIGGRAMAYPIRYLSLYEVVNDRIGKTPITPSW